MSSRSAISSKTWATSGFSMTCFPVTGLLALGRNGDLACHVPPVADIDIDADIGAGAQVRELTGPVLDQELGPRLDKHDHLLALGREDDDLVLADHADDLASIRVSWAGAATSSSTTTTDSAKSRSP